MRNNNIIAHMTRTPDEEDTAPSEPVSSHATIAAIKTLRCFAQQQTEGACLFDVIATTEDRVYKMIPGLRKQTKITDFLKSN